ncbi:hypothetical protein [Undibacterium terreum]|uniref:hypothetical protein n=1 Tax=Undibacterium terreum TaxID=1224302 RepID=UPI001665556B|nr:hypothetical protein [Undibacterium terreum]
MFAILLVLKSADESAFGRHEGYHESPCGRDDFSYFQGGENGSADIPGTADLQIYHGEK